MIYFVFGRPEVELGEKGTDLAFASLGMEYELLAGDLMLRDKPAGSLFNRWIKIEDRWFQVCRLNPGLSFKDAEAGDIYVTDDTGEKLEMAPEITFLLRYALPKSISGSHVVGEIDGYKDSGDESLFLANPLTNSFIYRPGLRLNKISIEDGEILAIEFWDGAVRKLDFELNDIWSFEPESSLSNPLQPMPCRNSVVYYHGFSGMKDVQETPIPEQGIAHVTSVLCDGELYGLDRETGVQRWLRKFPEALSDLVVHDDKVYCVAEDELFCISAEDGEIVARLKLEYSTGGETEMYKVLSVIDNKLWITINHWLDKAFCLLVVDLESFAVKHRIDIPAPYAPDLLLHYDATNRQVIYRLR